MEEIIFYIIVIMYLRTSTRKNRDGSGVTYLQIAENVWNPKKRRSETRLVCTLGRADGKGQERLRQLAASIRRHASFETMAQLEPGWKFLDSWEYGPFYVLCEVWERLGIRRILEEALRGEDRSVPFERAILAMVANRALAPASKLFCYESWVREEVYFPEGEAIQLHHLYRAMDFLAAHKEEIEKELYWQVADLLSLDVDLIFYDTTTLYFELDEEDEGEEALRVRGHSKDGRDDVPQVVVGLAVTRDGLPIKSWVFPGNTPDVTTIAQVKEELRGWRLNRCVFVTDAGMVSEENLHTLARGGSSYVVAMPCKKGGEVVTEVLSRPGRFSVVCDNLRVKEVWVGDGQRRRRYVVCFNPAEAERQRNHREKVLAELEAELAGLSNSGEGHPKRGCELLSSRRYGRYLRKLKDGRLRVNKTAIREASKRDGLWVIRTNDESLTREDLALAYKQGVRVEEAWKTMKSGLKVRPIYHRTPERIRAHIFLCVLALLLERVVENACGWSWRKIRAELRSIKVGQLLTPNGTLYQRSPIRATSHNILKQMKVKPPAEILAVE
ncbi:MAG: IS1634 family transposase [Anaerolineae bacterium]